MAEMERWVGARDDRLLQEAKEILREDPEVEWEEPELRLLDGLLTRVIQEGRLYEGLEKEETYYLTQLLIDLFDELVESEAVLEEVPLEALDQALGPLAVRDARLEEARRWLIQGRLLGSDRTVWDRTAAIEEFLPYFGYVRQSELAPLAAAAEAAAAAGRPPRPAARDRTGPVLKQLAAACREALDTERDLLSFVS
jgi:hypothetical protein